MTPPGVEEIRGVTQPSPHVTWDELACRDAIRTPYPLDWRETRLPMLLEEFEAVRAELSATCGQDIPLTIVSAYRTPEHNAKQPGSASDSQHLHGRALDIRPPKGSDLVDALYEIVLRRAKSVGKIRGVGRYNSFVHMDIRPSARLMLWDLRGGV